MNADAALLSVRGLSVTYRAGGRRLTAVSDVSFDVGEGEVVGLIGESGCGKSSIGRAVARLGEHGGGTVAGSIRFDGREVSQLRGPGLREFRRGVQMIFQDPVSSLNPKRRIGDLVEEGLLIAGGRSASERRSLVRATIAEVGLDPDAVADRFPHEFSGGQCQRVSIARALVVGPRLLICDEPVSALDASVQAQILNLLDELRVKRRLAMLFISHDMAVVKNVSDRVLVMYLGRNLELGPAEQICRRPAHPYTAALLSSVPTLRDEDSGTTDALSGEIPSPYAPPPGCPLHVRCPRALPVCARAWPARSPGAVSGWIHCHNPRPPEDAVPPDAAARFAPGELA